MLPWDPQGKIGPKKPLPDHISVMEPKEDTPRTDVHPTISETVAAAIQQMDSNERTSLIATNPMAYPVANASVEETSQDAGFAF